MIRSVIFDLDGVLVDAQDWHYTAFNEALMEVAGFAIPMYQHIMTYDGLGTMQKLDILRSSGKVETDQFDDIHKLKQVLTREKILADCTRDEKKVEIMENLKTLGIKIGCATNCSRDTATMMLKGAGILEYFDSFLTKEDVRKPKPSPEIYIASMVNLQSHPKNTLIFEDTSRGIEAARGSQAYLCRVQQCSDLDWFKVDLFLRTAGRDE